MYIMSPSQAVTSHSSLFLEPSAPPSSHLMAWDVVTNSIPQCIREPNNRPPPHICRPKQVWAALSKPSIFNLLPKHDREPNSHPLILFAGPNVFSPQHASKLQQQPSRGMQSQPDAQPSQLTGGVAEGAEQGLQTLPETHAAHVVHASLPPSSALGDGIQLPGVPPQGPLPPAGGDGPLGTAQHAQKGQQGQQGQQAGGRGRPGSAVEPSPPAAPQRTQRPLSGPSTASAAGTAGTAAAQVRVLGWEEGQQGSLSPPPSRGLAIGTAGTAGDESSDSYSSGYESVGEGRRSPGGAQRGAAKRPVSAQLWQLKGEGVKDVCRQEMLYVCGEKGVDGQVAKILQNCHSSASIKWP